jgi:hypothetical protein
VEPAESPHCPDDPVPDEVVRAARSAFGGRSARELASLVYDSLIDDTEPPDDHLLRFEHQRFRFEVNVSARSADVDLAGCVEPGVGGRVELALDHGQLSFVTDTLDGTFSFGPVGHGLVRICFDPSDGPPIRTDWFRI